MKSDNHRQVILDIEATGVGFQEGDRIIELAAVEMVDGRFTYRTYRTLLNPRQPIDEGAQAIHGITEEYLEHAPEFEEISDELSEFLRGAELIVHNAPFHVEFLDMEFDQIGMPTSKELCSGVIDTLAMARKLRPERVNSIDALIEDFAIQIPKRTLNGCELDAHLIGIIYLVLKNQLLH